MHLASLTLFGFKSFVDRTSIDFQPGITAIVGPNGCGKSNIADAIRWVLGEQSAKALRGERMEDLIFSGNLQRKPIGMAEVSLTLGMVGGQLPVPYEEVTITRRLYRSGESEYLLNQVPCRLRDITGLFLDTGLGSEPYALIAQGALASLLNARPVERRTLLEEAAGIMAYKVKRRAALSRLEAAQQNLLRLQDILAEITRQRDSLHRQAKKAERYRRLEARLTLLKLVDFLSETTRRETEHTALQREEHSLTEEEVALQARISESEAAIEADRLRDLELEQAMTALHQRLSDVRARRERLESERETAERRANEMAARTQTAAEELRTVTERQSTLEMERANLHQTLTNLLRDIRDNEAALAAFEGRVAEFEEEAAVCEAEREELRGRFLQVTGELLVARNSVAHQQTRRKELETDRSEVLQRMTTSRETAASVSAEMKRLAARLAELEAEIDGLNSRKGRIQEELVVLQHRQGLLADERARARESLRGLESRLQSLEELEATFEGYGEGQRFLLLARSEGAAACAGVEGPLSHFLQVPAQYEKAIEALLGNLLQGLVTPSDVDALCALRYLEGKGRGWATFLPRLAPWLSKNGMPHDMRREIDRVLGRLGPEVAGRVFGPAIDLVQGDNDLKPLLHHLLGDAVVVQDLPTAIAVTEAIPFPVRAATARGELVSGSGPLVGGETATTGLLGRTREIDELQERIRAESAGADELESGWREIGESLERTRCALAKTEETLKVVEQGRRDADGSLAELRAVDSRVGSQIELFSDEVAAVGEEIARIACELEAAEALVETLAQEETTIRGAIEEVEARLASTRARRDALHREYTEVRVSFGSLQERREGLSQTGERIEAELLQLMNDQNRFRLKIEEAHTAEAAARAKAGTLVAELTTHARSEEALRGDQRTLQHERDALRIALHEREETLKEVRRQVAAHQQRIGECRTRLAEVGTTRTLLHQRLREETGLTPEGLRQRLDQEESLPDAEAAQVEAEEVKAKLSAMGATNLAALEEYEALMERHDFLAAQAQDLTMSVTSLKATIAEVNRTIRGRFARTLAAVDAHFNQYWQRLFDGGEAHLVLNEAPEEEEPGVEMTVRIPGKRMTNLLLLSGGEKTLGALAFLVALCAVRPSPFVLLDEVDAALDDANVERFIHLVRELAADTQFLLITHHPRTMEAADVLFGVTMEEAGVSKLVSVRLCEEAMAS